MYMTQSLSYRLKDPTRVQKGNKGTSLTRKSWEQEVITTAEGVGTTMLHQAITDASPGPQQGLDRASPES